MEWEDWKAIPKWAIVLWILSLVLVSLLITRCPVDTGIEEREEPSTKQAFLLADSKKNLVIQI
ncbi:hypothetical protein MYX65_09255 [Acidobacteria bacterium AH-259-L09]|nr:hypothetical protein [Acidobacteria bacterium AH-259-L09]